MLSIEMNEDKLHVSVMQNLHSANTVRFDPETQ